MYQLLLPIAIVATAISILGVFYLASKSKLPEEIGYICIPLGISSFLLAIKRWHDMDKSAWYLITLFIPFINIAAILELVIFAGDEAENKYGPSTNAT